MTSHIIITTGTLLRELSRFRLAEIARMYGIALPDKAREEQVEHLLATIEINFSDLLGHLTREELRRACRTHSLDDTGRSRAKLAETLLAVFDGDSKAYDVSGLFASSRIDREAPISGDVIRLRHRQWLVEDVIPPPEQNQLTLIKAVCLDDDNQGETIDVLWEMELGANVVQQKMGGLGANIDEPRHFAAYLHALKWNSVTATDRNLFQAPFRAGIMLQAHQLEPLRRALSLPRANLFIADDVGLGKTIEAGLVLQELLLRQRVEFILISCPASVCLQWRDEMFKRFGLQFEVMNRALVERRRRERGFGVNPWSTHNRFIISHDLLRRPEYREPLLNTLGDKAKRSLLVLDEAHVAAPSSASNYATDSNITKVIRDVAPRFENRLFLSATPHNGHSNSFASLLELLDPQRFTRGVPVTDSKQRDAVMVRRLKEDLRVLNRGSYPLRKLVRHSLKHDGERWMVEAADCDSLYSAQCIGASFPFELQLVTMLNQYSALRTEIGKGGRLALINLQKRLLSSVAAFSKTLKKHAEGKSGVNVLNDSESLNKVEIERDDLYGDEIEDETKELEAIVAATANLSPPNEQALKLLKEMSKLAQRHQDDPDAKILGFLSWVRQNQCPTAGFEIDSSISKAWSDRRVIIFTESMDTKTYIERQLQRSLAHTEDGHRRVMTFHGGLGDDKRAEIQQAFNSPPNEHPVRILIATDAAREGVNLQGHCADLFHYDIPWNPARMEQRNGRIDRTLQSETEVRCHYFVYADRDEDIVLDKLVQKVNTIQRELGSLSAVIMGRIESQLQKEGISATTASLLNENEREKRQVAVAKKELEQTRVTQKELAHELEKLDEILARSEKVTSFEPKLLRDAINAGLELSGAAPLQLAPGAVPGAEAFTLPELPESWAGTIDSLRLPRGRDEYFSDWRAKPPLPVLFEPPPKMNSAAAQLHLSHPFVKRIFSRFLSQGYSAHDLNRVTIVRSNDSFIRVIAFGRLSLFGKGAARLHDQLVSVAARWVETSSEPLKPFTEAADRKALESLEQILVESPTLEGISDSVKKKVIEAAPTLFSQLWKHVETEADARAKEALLELERRGHEEADQLKEILERQRDAIESQLQLKTPQFEFNFEPLTRGEQKQVEAEKRHMEHRLLMIDREIREDPADLKSLYNVSLNRLQPVGLVVLWPKTRG
ncbi:DISARM system SNF2-like helicase DrmD [Shewanella pealeana]|uniref:Helicase domain protein n=1 Tax=Shewanella pealeana (strain ATCC 700345 / ANG-SQ1) TaxID=398579 RepID=A8H211_SHEPA|nr:DISARM system SNF2-like helicase DrmD [Shewanella pealeana]ABV86598.1 helicase domain protein [Shewanella pealeana ATCC 700345]